MWHAKDFCSVTRDAMRNDWGHINGKIANHYGGLKSIRNPLQIVTGMIR
jgi:hypothetical protein